MQEESEAALQDVTKLAFTNNWTLIVGWRYCV
jgi:hypothetical protein